MKHLSNLLHGEGAAAWEGREVENNKTKKEQVRKWSGCRKKYDATKICPATAVVCWLTASPVPPSDLFHPQPVLSQSESAAKREWLLAPASGWKRAVLCITVGVIPVFVWTWGREDDGVLWVLVSWTCPCTHIPSVDYWPQGYATQADK